METYDYIVIGAGSAGCVVASRLSEDKDIRVLLLEAGPAANSFWVKTPAGVGKLFHDSRFNWRYFTEPIRSMQRRKVYWPRGKVLGGTSAINGMVYMRGHPRDFDEWAAKGNPGWSWSEVLPYFLRSESNTRGASPFHGAEGPMCVSDPVLQHPTTDDFVEAAARAGIPRAADLNGPPHEGVGYQQFTIRDGRRHSSYDAFIAPVRHRPNLHVRSGIHVMRIVFEGRDATGVEVLEGGQRRVIHAAREVIVSAGALNSPHLLMLSGIGDGNMLQRFGITTLHHLPGVGRNLQDHFFAPQLLQCTPESSYNSSLHGLRKYWHGLRYLMTRGGYLALGMSPASAYVRSSPDSPQPDLQLVLRPMTFNFHPSSGEVMIDKFPGLSGVVVLLLPRSSGYVELASADPLQAPQFHPNYLGDNDDVQRMVIGMRMLRRILATEPLATRIVRETVPGAGAVTDEQLIDHLRAHGNCAWHQVGTCKMGNDQMAVVDARLRVRGVNRLRVIDASVMPQITAGNTSAPAMMIGEKGAEMIREDARDKDAFQAQVESALRHAPAVAKSM
ncbi:choline dehydrogenase [Paraburkholderia sp. WC7.3g]|uniref:Choline dehydrogenase n=1 Tax=Paraburkholderia podalyriae TaxID=1938811 RepID=A0ABR7PIG4_9BURK|nr:MULTISPECIES: GMC family oxidoreductase N-terminal domain-containing protein [Paraburkholderia]MBB5406366.1 choline dehydrogenase [Paraburkholderia sp. HC6.4b]MBB5448764.1 choline dehydrogenase [Paraburkholderia sp. Kb1A]MBC8745971.1 choline dehydrogenase [Paraburkholderia podalyriae]